MVGNSFTHSCNDWSEGTFENFKEWSLRQFGVKDLDSDDEAEVPVQMMKSKSIVFEMGESGALVLPPMSNFKTIKQKQRVLRGYIGATYSQSFPTHISSIFLTKIIGQFTGSSNSAFPYFLASEEGQQIYSVDSVPEDFVLSDPDHLKAQQINSLYGHLLQRQDEDLPPFVILNSSPHHPTAVKKTSHKAKGKAKADWVDMSDDEGGSTKDDGGNGVGEDSDDRGGIQEGVAGPSSKRSSKKKAIKSPNPSKKKSSVSKSISDDKQVMFQLKNIVPIANMTVIRR